MRFAVAGLINSPPRRSKPLARRWYVSLDVDYDFHLLTCSASLSVMIRFQITPPSDNVLFSLRCIKLPPILIRDVRAGKVQRLRLRRACKEEVAWGLGLFGHHSAVSELEFSRIAPTADFPQLLSKALQKRDRNSLR